MEDKKKALKKVKDKPAPDISLKCMYVRVNTLGLQEVVIPVAQVEILMSPDLQPLKSVIFQLAGKKYHSFGNRWQAVPRGKKFVMPKEMFKGFYKVVEFQDKYHKEFFKEENRR